VREGETGCSVWVNSKHKSPVEGRSRGFPRDHLWSGCLRAWIEERSRRWGYRGSRIRPCPGKQRTRVIGEGALFERGSSRPSPRREKIVRDLPWCLASGFPAHRKQPESHLDLFPMYWAVVSSWQTHAISKVVLSAMTAKMAPKGSWSFQGGQAMAWPGSFLGEARIWSNGYQATIRMSSAMELGCDLKVIACGSECQRETWICSLFS
jgi:hypothetical protein